MASIINTRYVSSDTNNMIVKPDIRVEVDEETGYFRNIEEIRQREYSTLTGTTYLDHAGTTPYANSAIQSWTAEMTSNLFGNPHSNSASSQSTTSRIEDVRLKVLRFFNASPEHFDIVFVSNATAAVKLVAEAFQDIPQGFWYSYHTESHTSLVGIRELAVSGSYCFRDEHELRQGFENGETHSYSPQMTGLVSFPGQSNMTGRRFLPELCGTIRELSRTRDRQIFSLFDAAGYVSSSALDFSNAEMAPDFTALSFYKIFGFPDLGALIVRKQAGHMLLRKKFFAGGTVEMVTCGELNWHAKKDILHDALEEGTLPFHNILALDHSMSAYRHLYGSISNISQHTKYLATIVRQRLRNLRHANGLAICQLYSDEDTGGDLQGPVIAFNFVNQQGRWVSAHEVEKLSIVKNIQLRTGGLCNPGGIATHLKLSPAQMQRNYHAGQRCGGGNDIIEGQPTGVIRISLGAMSSLSDVETFLAFVEEFFVDRATEISPSTRSMISIQQNLHFYIESLSVFPIKSCAAFKIPTETAWEVTTNGLAWDREWCLVHEGTHTALSQKRFPQMALLRPTIDLSKRKLVIYHSDSDTTSSCIKIDMDQITDTTTSSASCFRESKVCDDKVVLHIYTAANIVSFFTNAIGVPCTLARYPRNGPVRYSNIRRMSSKMTSHLHANDSNSAANMQANRNTIMLSNESPILLVSRSSVNKLNEDIKARNSVLSSPASITGGSLMGKAVTADSFRGNIVVAQMLGPNTVKQETPYIEDTWSRVMIRHKKSGQQTSLNVLGPCQRCQMVCVDQDNAKRRQEPFSTLAKTRRKDGKVWFGMHLGMTLDNTDLHHAPLNEGQVMSQIMVGDSIACE